MPTCGAARPIPFASYGDFNLAEIGNGARYFFGLNSDAGLVPGLDGNAAVDVDWGDDGRIVAAGDEDRHVLGIGAAIAIVDGDREHQRDRFAGGEEVEIAVGNGVIPVDGSVVRIAARGRNSEGIFQCRLLRRG